MYSERSCGLGILPCHTGRVKVNRPHSEQFLTKKEEEEKKPLNFKSNNNEKYNKTFSMRELKKSIKKTKNSSAGPDDIHYQLLKHLPDSTLTILLIVTKFGVQATSPHFGIQQPLYPSRNLAKIILIPPTIDL